MSAEGNRGAPGAAAAGTLRRSIEAQIAQLTEDPQSAIVRPWVRTELERGVLGVSRFTQYGTEYEFRSDEALDRGGEASAPSPMRYLLSGVAFCLQGWTAKCFAQHDVPLDALAVELRTTMDMRGELLLGDVPAHPQWLVAELTVTSSASATSVADLVAEAVDRCPLSALLKRAIPLYVKITLRGVVISDDRPPPLHNEENEEQTR
ncbi:hypothetical protein ASC66_07045 [Leifsonia sp. Root4]|uniref:OsmC family protein n=1 Tax=Leifsonia sp. Root4 TaxID=1736525 RepID=UPI0006FDB0E7|nr:OsmC family protein [Leifsonia sp. Root4]KQW06273.1 hypothetical protein ASC66_07045 [Leifsonia sp. Root4]